MPHLGLGRRYADASTKANGTRVQAMGASFRKAIEKEHASRFYRHNWLYLVAGVLLSVLTVVLLLVVGGFDEEIFAVMIGQMADSRPCVLFRSFAATNITASNSRSPRTLGATDRRDSWRSPLRLWSAWRSFPGFFIGFLDEGDPDLTCDSAMVGWSSTNVVFFN